MIAVFERIHQIIVTVFQMSGYTPAVVDDDDDDFVVINYVVVLIYLQDQN